MISKSGWRSILLLSLMFLLEVGTSQVLAQGRTSGKTRDAGKANGTRGVRDPAPDSNERREIGRTRPTEPVITPVSKEPREVERTDPQPPHPSAEHAPPPPPPQRPSGRHPVPADRSPQVVIVGGGGICGGGSPIDPPSGWSGSWIRGGISLGKDVTIAESHWMPDFSGFDFSEMLKRPFYHPFTDMFVEREDGGLVMRVWEDTEIMDIGFVGVPLDAIYLPRVDWSATHSARLFAGHEYVVRTWDYHYAKFHVTGLLDDRVSFDWAYQYAREGNWDVTRALSRGELRR